MTSSLASTVPSAGTPVDRSFGHVRQSVPVEYLEPVTVVEIGPGRPLGVGRCPTRTLDQLGDRPGLADAVVEPTVEDLQKDPLGPAVVRLVGRGDQRAIVVAEPERASCRLIVAMLASVLMRGCCPVWRACSSAGRPNASYPIVWSTLKPVMRLNRAYTSVLMYPSGWPT